MSEYDLHYKPKDLIPNVVYTPGYTELTAEEKETLEGVHQNLKPYDITQLCRACGWNTEHELGTSYLPRLRIQHTPGDDKGLWKVGNDWLFWDRTQENCGNDYITHQFLQKQNTKHIPLLKRMAEFNDENGGYNFVVMSRAKAEPSENVWDELSDKEKRSYADQMVAALRELRQHTAEFPQRVDGSPVWDNVIGNCGLRKECIKIGKTKEEWLNSMDEELREGISRLLKTQDKAVVEARLQEITQNFPDGTPYVLTHADLNLGNILVHDGKIEAIIDWELAGYQPWWVEVFTSYYRAISDAGEELFDMVWKDLNLSIADVRKDVGPFIQAFRAAPVQHTDRDPVWQRPAFCKCKPFGGIIHKHLIDSEEKHFVNHEALRLSEE